MYIILTEGAPSLRPLQGWVAILPTQLLFFRTKSVAHAFVVPALCKLRKGRGTLGPVSASNQSPGQPAGGWPTFNDLVYILLTEGAPSLRSLQGWVAMLPTQLLFCRTKSVVHEFVVPALCKLRKGRGTLGPVSASNQSPGQPAAPNRAIAPGTHRLRPPTTG